MLTVDDYMDAAKTAQNIPSDRELGRRVGVGPTAATNWRTRRTWPEVETMRRLAELANMDTEQALMDCVRWRASTPEVRQVWDRIAAKIASSIAIIVVAGFGVGQPAQVSAKQASHDIFHNIHYATFTISKHWRGATQPVPNVNVDYACPSCPAMSDSVETRNLCGLGRGVWADK